MLQFEADSLVEQAVLIGLINREQAREAMAAAEDGSLVGVGRSLLRKGFLTSWQLDRLQKGDGTGFFYGGCRILFHIAEGTFARVYRGAKEPAMQSVAVKVLRRRFANDPEAVIRFDHEAEAGMKLIHPNIVRVLDHGAQDGAHYMIMEYVEGSNLRDFLKLRHRISHEQALPLMIGLAEGLEYALSQGITHRDIKATNILISHSGEAKLVDFGLATIEGDQKKMEKMHGVRTVDYAALERLCGSPKGDPRSDIYFLGCVFYQMLTGQPPLPETEGNDPLQKMLKRSFGAIRPLSEHGHAPPEALTAIIEKMMKTDLKLRYQEIKSVVDDLKAYERGAATSQPKPKAPEMRSIEEALGVDDFREKSAEQPEKQPAEQPEERPEEEPSPSPTPEPALQQKQVICVEAQEPIQEAFRKQLTAMGFKIFMTRHGERAWERYLEIPSDILVFDADGQGREALDFFHQIHQQATEDKRTLVALLLLGPRQKALRDELPGDAHLIVLDKPVKMRQVQEALERLAELKV